MLAARSGQTLLSTECQLRATIAAVLQVGRCTTLSPCAVAGAPLRMPVHDVFKARQGGVCVGGKLEAGGLKPGSKLLVVPGYETATVKSLEVNGQVRRWCRHSVHTVITILCKPYSFARAASLSCVAATISVPASLFSGCTDTYMAGSSLAASSR
jgi:hypothetical protein